MLDRRNDQAAGLSALKLQPPMRVLPVVCSADGHRWSLELLWRLEQALQQQGLPVAVVEGVQGLRPADARLGHRRVLQRWLRGVPEGSVVLLHAPLEAQAVLLADSTARPLIPLTGAPAALVQAYNAIKVLWQVAGLWPVVLALQEAGGGVQPGRLEAAAQSLLQGCERHLGRVPPVWPLGYDSAASGAQMDADESCVLKVLDTALVLEDPENRSHVDDLPERCPPSAADQTIGVSDVHRQRHA